MLIFNIGTCLFFAQLNAANFFVFSKTKQKHVSSKAHSGSIKFFLYQKESTTPVIVAKSNATRLINLNLETFIIIHGWTDNGTLPWIIECARKLHEVGEFNVIAADWSYLASGNLFTAALNIKTVGYRIRHFIKEVNMIVDKIQIIAHSLGAQVASYVARALRPEKLEQIVGLDPAGPLLDWPVNLLNAFRLRSGNAKCVQVIHTSVILKGITIPSGTIDFYVNTGSTQPGCPANDSVSCSHQMAHTYFILTITNMTKYPGTKWCPLHLFGCKPTLVYMGFGVNATNCKLGIIKVKTEATGINPYTQF